MASKKSKSMRPTRETRRAARKTRRGAEVTRKLEPLGTVGAEDLTELNEAKAAHDVAKAEAMSSGAAAQLLLTKALAAAKAPIETSLICLTCGSIYHRRGRTCPTCPEEAPAA